MPITWYHRSLKNISFKNCIKGAFATVAWPPYVWPSNGASECTSHRCRRASLRRSSYNLYQYRWHVDFRSEIAFLIKAYRFTHSFIVSKFISYEITGSGNSFTSVPRPAREQAFPHHRQLTSQLHEYIRISIFPHEQLLMLFHPLLTSILL